MVERDDGRDNDPMPGALSLFFPSGLVDVEDRLFRQGLSYRFLRGRQGFRDLLMKLADRSQTNINPENRLGDFLATPSSHSV
jgi:hypothetical protein